MSGPLVTERRPDFDELGRWVYVKQLAAMIDKWADGVIANTSLRILRPKGDPYGSPDRRRARTRHE